MRRLIDTHVIHVRIREVSSELKAFLERDSAQSSTTSVTLTARAHVLDSIDSYHLYNPEKIQLTIDRVDHSNWDEASEYIYI